MTVALFDGDGKPVPLEMPPLPAPTAPRPVPVASARPLANCTSVAFDASASTGAAPLAFHWLFGDGAESDAAVIAHPYAKPGEYQAVLDVLGAGNSVARGARATVPVHVRPAPVAVAGDAVVAAPGEAVAFDGSGSKPSDSPITRFHWTFGDGAEAEGATATHVYERPGLYRAVLRVEDASNHPCDFGLATREVKVNFAPVAEAGTIGAHITAYFGSAFFGLHWSFLLIVVLAALACALAGVIIGVPTLRLRGDYVGIVTLAFGEIVGQVVANGREIHVFGGTLTGGPNGIAVIDRIKLPFLARFDPLDLRPWWWFAVAMVALMLVVNVRLRDSRVGRAWLAMREDERAAEASGIPIMRTKLLAYGVGAALGGISGAFLTSFNSVADPAQFTFSFSIFILAMVVLGGIGSIWGAVAGAVILTVFDSYLLPRVLYNVPGKLGLDFDLSAVASGIYGFLLVTIMLLRPQGLIPAGRRSVARSPSGGGASG